MGDDDGKGGGTPPDVDVPRPPDPEPSPDVLPPYFWLMLRGSEALRPPKHAVERPSKVRQRLSGRQRDAAQTGATVGLHERSTCYMHASCKLRMHDCKLPMQQGCMCTKLTMFWRLATANETHSRRCRHSYQINCCLCHDAI